MQTGLERAQAQIRQFNDLGHPEAAAVVRASLIQLDEILLRQHEAALSR